MNRKERRAAEAAMRQRKNEMGHPKLIDKQWRNFSERVLPAEASIAQRMEMRRVFYAGAGMLMNEIMNVLDPGEEPTDADMATFDLLHDELEQFGKDVADGKA